MKARTATTGATLIVVMLLTLLMLAVVLAASMRLGLASRQNTGDQKAILQAQYTAESMTGLATLRIREIQNLLSASNIQVPANTPSTDIKAYAENYCGNSNWTDSIVGGISQSTCKVTQNTAGSNQFGAFAAYVKSAAYTNILPTNEINGAGTAAWWKQRLGQDFVISNGSSEAKFKIQPSKVEKFDDYRFRFYLKLNSIKAKGVAANASRYLTASGVKNGEWWIEISRPPFLDNVLFTNHHHSRDSSVPDVGFRTQDFDGPVHTNEKFLFYKNSSTESISFRKVGSAGCTNLASLSSQAVTCTREAGVYLGSGSGLTKPTTGTTEANVNSNLQSKIDTYTNVNWNGITPNFQANYRPMPTTSETQKADAQDKGLYLNSTVQKIELKAGNSSGTAPTSFDPATGKYSPAPTHQYITVYESSSKKVEYRYASDRQLQRRNTSGGWDDVPNRPNFNGVIFSDNTIGYKGGERKYGGLSGPANGPALAPFAQMTVSAQKDIYISGHLKMSEEPLVCQNGSANFQTCKADANTRTNVLGIYAQGTSNSNSDISVTYDAPNNLTLHAMIMTSTGEMNVQYPDQLDRGDIKLIGGLVENYYGIFRSGGKGYGRDFKYDRRYQDNPGFGPPSFPISPVWEPKDASSDEDGTLPLEQRIRLYRSSWQQSAQGNY